MEVAVEAEGNPQDATLRRSTRRAALTEINDVINGDQTPKSTSPDEQIIIQRGPRKKPLTWSPYEYNRAKILGPPREKTPERIVSPKPDINLKLRRRLILTSDKNTEVYVGDAIARRLRSFKKLKE